MRQLRVRNGAGRWGPLSSILTHLVTLPYFSLVQGGAVKVSSRGWFKWGCHSEQGPRGPSLLRGHLPVRSEWRHVEDGGPDREPWGRNGGQGMLLGGGSTSSCLGEDRQELPGSRQVTTELVPLCSSCLAVGPGSRLMPCHPKESLLSFSQLHSTPQYKGTFVHSPASW